MLRILQRRNLLKARCFSNGVEHYDLAVIGGGPGGILFKFY